MNIMLWLPLMFLPVALPTLTSACLLRQSYAISPQEVQGSLCVGPPTIT